MYDQLIIGERASYDDFDASVASRKITLPKKKEIKETVPFSNITYDFSAINGELYWEEGELEYVLEITAPTPEKLERKKTALSAWLKNIVKENLIDPYDTEYHYIATCDDVAYDDDESQEKTTATVKFKAYPYKIANRPKEYVFSIPAGSTISTTIYNDSAHKITPTLVCGANLTINIDDTSYSIPAGEITDSKIKLAVGGNTLTIQNATETDSTLTVIFYEELF